MKTINILSLVQAKINLENENYKKFLTYYSVEIKDKEVEDLKVFIETILKIKKDIKILDQYYVGYSIPQIGKEFDLLRFGEDCIVNIELKSSSTEEKILKQLQRNKYYLGFLKKEIHHFTFVSDTTKLYYLNDSNTLDEVAFKKLVKPLLKQKLINIGNIDKLFNPSGYLVSPFNSTKKFIKNEYFLTKQQEEIKTEIEYILSADTKANFVSLLGSAGTGKTLLAYDIAKEFMGKGKKVLVIHCGKLNDGQSKLNSKYKWKIIPIKSYESLELSTLDLIIIDEAQRIYPNQFDDIVKKIEEENGNCIFSHDKVQTLRLWEEQNQIHEKIESISDIQTYKLTEKIRTNANIANFIKMLFNVNRNSISIDNKDNIELNYFTNENEVKEYLKHIKILGWKVIRYTPSKEQPYHEKFMISADNSHEVIGQEFDNVAVVIDDAFKYNERGKLQYTKKSYYHPIKMLFQNLTRARKKLNIVIVNNDKVLERCLSVLR